MKTILFIIFLLFSINGFAFNWKKVANSVEGDSYYVDADNIKKHNRLVYYWMLLEFLEPKMGANSSVNKYKVDCEEEKQTWLSVTFYSQSTGRGKILQDESLNRIKYPKPNSVMYWVMKYACDNAK